MLAHQNQMGGGPRGPQQQHQQQHDDDSEDDDDDKVDVVGGIVNDSDMVIKSPSGDNDSHPPTVNGQFMNPCFPFRSVFVWDI